MFGRAIRCNCPHCGELVIQVANLSGPNFCPSCRKLFARPRPEPIPRWVWGVLVILVVNLQMRM